MILGVGANEPLTIYDFCLAWHWFQLKLEFQKHYSFFKIFHCPKCSCYIIFGKFFLLFACFPLHQLNFWNAIAFVLYQTLSLHVAGIFVRNITRISKFMGSRHFIPHTTFVEDREGSKDQALLFMKLVFCWQNCGKNYFSKILSVIYRALIGNTSSSSNFNMRLWPILAIS